MTVAPASREATAANAARRAVVSAMRLRKPPPSRSSVSLMASCSLSVSTSGASAMAVGSCLTGRHLGGAAMITHRRSASRKEIASALSVKTQRARHPVISARGRRQHLRRPPALGVVYVPSVPCLPVAGGTPASGQLLPIPQNTALFSLLGTTYGGDGVSTFALPDLRSITPNGMTSSDLRRGHLPVGPLGNHASAAILTIAADVGARVCGPPV